MPLAYDQLRQALAGERLPAAFIDLDALDRNLDRVIALTRAGGLPLRVATKSVRSVGILERLRARGGAALKGLLCYTIDEAAHLAARGFDDLLVAYPAFQQADLDRAARLAADGVDLSLTADAPETIERLSRTAVAIRTKLKIVLCVDMSLRFAGLHLGVRRSPLHAVAAVVELATLTARQPGLIFHGLMGYEAQVAGLGDANPWSRPMNPVRSLVKRLSASELGERRAAMVEALGRSGLAPALVNGGGTGSLDTTTRATGVTEVSAGSAFFKPHLFDYYRNEHMQTLEPAAFFALEITRLPAPGWVTCAGGGYVASGPAGVDKIPRPWLPEGLSLSPDEMAGEVQTPLRVPAGSALKRGDPVIFRHAKSGELAERFHELVLLEGGRVTGRTNTYRGDGRCFH